MQFDFDTPIVRKNTWCTKWDMPTDFGRDDVIPMWIADMDFASPEPVREALMARAAQGAYGYIHPPKACAQAQVDWQRARNGWAVEPDWILDSPGVVGSIRIAINALTAPGDGIIINPPVYGPFFSSVREAGRTLVEVPLRATDGFYEMDFAGIEAAMAAGAKAMILCSPHNPVGRVWTAEELARLGALCRRYGVLLISDEIHSDLILPGHTHIPAPKGYGEGWEKTVTLTSTTKTFNLAGLQLSSAIIPDPELRAAFRHQRNASGVMQNNLMAEAARYAAYTQGAPWLDALRVYLDDNCAAAIDFMARRMPKARCRHPEATYLLWVDLRGYGMEGEDAEAFFGRKAGVFIGKGKDYGQEGDGFIRINVACPRSQVMAALERMAQALEDR